MKKYAGRDTWHSLQEWDREQAVAERLVAQVILIEGYKSVDPSHPLGGPDGLKDIVCEHNDKSYVVACYFPRTRQKYTAIKKKFLGDSEGVHKNKAEGFVFVTNQELTLAEREKLASSCEHTVEVEIYHLERLAAILNAPQCYGIRLEFLDIEMSKEEQLSFFAFRDFQLGTLLAKQKSISSKVDEIIAALKNPGELKFEMIDTLKDFKEILNQISGDNRFNYAYSSSGHMSKLSVPLDEIVEFKKILDAITDNSYFSDLNQGKVSSLKVPLAEIKEFSEILAAITSRVGIGSGSGLALWTGAARTGNISDLRVPIGELREYESTLNRIVEKLKEKKELEK